jgi:hypothetical protein
VPPDVRAPVLGFWPLRVYTHGRQLTPDVRAPVLGRSRREEGDEDREGERDDEAREATSAVTPARFPAPSVGRAREEEQRRAVSDEGEVTPSKSPASPSPRGASSAAAAGRTLAHWSAAWWRVCRDGQGARQRWARWPGLSPIQSNPGAVVPSKPPARGRSVRRRCDVAASLRAGSACPARSREVAGGLGEPELRRRLIPARGGRHRSR